MSDRHETQDSHAQGHEGATESAPGVPDPRQVITPDWVAIKDNQPLQCDTPAEKDDRKPAKPTIDRHR